MYVYSVYIDTYIYIYIFMCVYLFLFCCLVHSICISTDMCSHSQQQARRCAARFSRTMPSEAAKKAKTCLMKCCSPPDTMLLRDLKSRILKDWTHCYRFMGIGMFLKLFENRGFPKAANTLHESTLSFNPDCDSDC